MRQGNPEPSLTDEEGVETKRQAPSTESMFEKCSKPASPRARPTARTRLGTEGEEIVQPTNPKGAAKAAVGGITAWLLVRIQPGPPFHLRLLRRDVPPERLPVERLLPGGHESCSTI